MKRKLKKFLQKNKIYILAFIVSGGISTCILNKEEFINLLSELGNKVISIFGIGNVICLDSVEELKNLLNLETKNLEDVYSAIDNNDNIDDKYVEIMKNQAYKLGESIDDEDYTILYYNIKNLKDIDVVSEKEMTEISSSITLGLFSSYNHKIILREDCDLDSTLSHETTHMYRTIVMEKGNKKYYYSFDGTNDGVALDEAITSKLSGGTSYKAYINYLSQFEKIIGKEKAEEIFYNGTIEELKSEFVNLYNSEYLFNKLIELIDKKIENEKNDSIEEWERLENSSSISTEIDKIFMFYKVKAYEKQIKASDNLLFTYEEKLNDLLMSDYYYMYFNENVLNSDKTYKELLEEFQLDILNYYNDINQISDIIVGIKDAYDLSKPVKLYNENSTSVILLDNNVTQQISFQRDETRNLENEFNMGFEIVSEKKLSEVVVNDAIYEEINNVQIRCICSNSEELYNNFEQNKVYTKY